MDTRFSKEDRTLPDYLLGTPTESELARFFDVDVIFFVAKSQNQNIVTYRANLVGGELHPTKPIEPMWVMYTKGVDKSTGFTHEEGITFYERKYYGVTVENTEEVDGVKIYKVYINALGNKQIISVFIRDGKPHAQVTDDDGKLHEFLSAFVKLKRFGTAIDTITCKAKNNVTGEIIQRLVDK